MSNLDVLKLVGKVDISEINKNTIYSIAMEEGYRVPCEH